MFVLDSQLLTSPAASKIHFLSCDKLYFLSHDKLYCMSHDKLYFLSCDTPPDSLLEDIW